MKNINQIVDDFTQALKRGEKITVEQVLAKHPGQAKKLKPLLQATQMLVSAGQRIRQKDKKVREEFKKELWADLERKITARHLAEIKKRKAQVEATDTMSLKKRLDFVLLFLFVKGRRNQIGEGIRGITRFIKLLFLLEKETSFATLVKPYYEFVPYKIGPFEPCVYQDLFLLEMAKLVHKQTYTYAYKSDECDSAIDEGFKFNNVATLYTLTEDGMRFARALAKWCDKKDRTILEKMRILKTYYGQASLKALLKYIYEKYPEYTNESEVIEEVLK